MSYYYGENGVLLPPFRINSTTTLSEAAFCGSGLWKNRNDMAGKSVYACGIARNNRHSVSV
ncbi:MAG: hypothetical protein ACFHHU_16585 [Porticoccaceae bacterium]